MNKQNKRNIGCVGWGVIILILLVIISGVINSANEAEEESIRVEKEREKQEWQEKRKAEREEKQRIEDETKLRLTDEMINNTIGEKVDVYGVEISVSKPFRSQNEKVWEGDSYKTRTLKTKYLIVTFPIIVKNNSEEDIKITASSFKLYGFNTAGTMGISEMELQFGENYLKRDTLLPGEEKSGTVSFYVDPITHFEKGKGNFELKLDLSDISFLHSDDKNQIEFDLQIENNYRSLTFSPK